MDYISIVDIAYTGYKIGQKLSIDPSRLSIQKKLDPLKISAKKFN